jgi:hypothetical protein
LQNVRDDNAGGEWRSAGVGQIHFCQHPRTARQEKTSVRSDIFTRKSTEDGLACVSLESSSSCSIGGCPGLGW